MVFYGNTERIIKVDFTRPIDTMNYIKDELSLELDMNKIDVFTRWGDNTLLVDVRPKNFKKLLPNYPCVHMYFDVKDVVTCFDNHVDKKHVDNHIIKAVLRESVREGIEVKNVKQLV